MAAKTAEFRLELDLEPHLAGRAIVAQCICYDGTLALLTTAPTDLVIAFGTPSTSASQSYASRLLRFGKGLIQSVELPPITTRFPNIQLLTDDSVLIAGSRCGNGPKGPELNTSVFSEHGELLNQFCLGDGIADVQVSSNDEIWVAYFDEGIFGTTDWEDPMGVAGLCVYDAEGELTWSYEPPGDNDTICDCYALNVTDNGVWTYYYMDFPIVRIDDTKKISMWKNGIGGATAIAVDGGRALLFGGQNDRTGAIVQTLGPDKIAREPYSYTLTLPGGLEHVRVLGRNADLHAVSEYKWYKLGINDLQEYAKY